MVRFKGACLKRVLTVAAALFLSTTSAQAATIDLSFNLTATGFVQSFPGQPQVAPVPVVTGQYRFVFDNSSDINATTNGLTATGLNLPSPSFFAYQANGDILSVGTRVSPGSFSGSPGTDGYGFFIFNASNANFSVPYFNYTSTAAGGTYDGFDITLSPPNNAVPEPDAWVMMIFGFGIIGHAMRRKRKSRPPVTA